ncbi:DNA polymerase III subunit alpha [Vibrio splendidus]
MPAFPTPDNSSEPDYLTRLSYEGLMKRLEDNYPDKLHDPVFVQQYKDRLQFELDTVIQMGFPGYFLIVSEFIQWSKANDIPVGPGRGSGAGSLVAYSLNITDLDPIPYDLLFERFLNPERVSMPDFDIDFCMDKRDLVIEHTANKYGKKAVSQIITFGTLAAKAAVKSAARTLGFPYGVGDRLSKCIPNEPGIKLGKALVASMDLKAHYDTDLDARKIIDFALKIEGLARQTGKHAGGVLISPTTLTDFTPTQCEADGTGLVSMYDKNDVETAGLVKFDYLGLKTLTIIDNAIKAANRDRAAQGLPPIDISKIPLDDEDVYKMYQNGETTAVFQVESSGMKELLKRMKPDRFEDLIALVALYRPGPLQSGMVDNFIDRKHGREEVSYPDVNYQHPSLKETLEPTYGIILYQEQVMKIAQVLAGYTLGGADMLRRAMGKKKASEMAKQRDTFREGAIKNGVNGDLSMKIFDLVEKFAGYGFNKSHSAAYALVSYQTAWLKTHYPAAFMAAVMSADSENTDKVVNFANESKRMGITIVPPSVNKSERDFVSEGQDKIYFGLRAIKSFGDSAINEVLNNRTEPFKDVFDFRTRCNTASRALDACIKAGMFDEFGYGRATLSNNIQTIIKYGKQNKASEAAQQFSLFGVSNEEEALIKPVKDWSQREKLLHEVTTMGLSVSGHLLDEYKEDQNTLSTGKLSELAEISMETADDGKQAVWRDKVVNILCAINIVDVRQGKTGTRAILKIDDGSRQIECMVFSNTFHKCQQFLVPHSVAFIKGKLIMDKKSETHKLIAFDVESLESLREKKIDSVSITLDSVNESKMVIQKKLQDLNSIIKAQPEGGCGIRATYIKSATESSDIAIGSKKLRYDDTLSNALNEIFGEDNVTINYKSEDRNADKAKKRFVEATPAELEYGARTRMDRHRNIANLLKQASSVMAR